MDNSIDFSPDKNNYEFYPAVTNPRKLDYIDNDFFIFNDLESIALNEEAPGRLDVSMISLCAKGYSRYSVNMQDYTASPGVMTVAFPDQILQSQEVSDDFKGVFIIISKKMSDEIFSRVKVMIRLFFYSKELPRIELTPEEVAVIMDYYDLIWKKVANKNESFTREVVQTLLVAFLYEIYGIYITHSRHVPGMLDKKNRKHIIFDQFMRLLSESYKKERSVNFYAERLYLTPKHLSSVIKEISGKTAGEWIDNFVIFEAKTLLKSSSKNIQEISDELNFANQSFFGKYFRHYAGMSPKEYRKK